MNCLVCVLAIVFACVGGTPRKEYYPEPKETFKALNVSKTVSESDTYRKRVRAGFETIPTFATAEVPDNKYHRYFDEDHKPITREAFTLNKVDKMEGTATSLSGAISEGGTAGQVRAVTIADAEHEKDKNFKKTLSEHKLFKGIVDKMMYKYYPEYYMGDFYKYDDKNAYYDYPKYEPYYPQFPYPEPYYPKYDEPEPYYPKYDKPEPYYPKYDKPEPYYPEPKYPHMKDMYYPYPQPKPHPYPYNEGYQMPKYMDYKPYMYDDNKKYSYGY